MIDTSAHEAQQQVRALTATMLNLKLFVMVRRTVRPKDLVPSLLVAHLQWMVAKEEQGKIFASGPFEVAGAERGAAGGLSILRAADEQEARGIADDDPLVRSGVVAYDMHAWLLMEGDLQLRVRLSQRSAQLG